MSTIFVDSGLSAALYGQTRRAVLALLYGHRRQGAATPSFSHFKPLPEGPGMMRILSQEEQRKYLSKASPQLRDFGTLILETGMRPEEVFTARKENIHLAHGYVFVPTGKTRFARRTIPLTDTAKSVLRRRVREAKGRIFSPAAMIRTCPLRR